jgi:predicted DNA-binding transcriptional regulator YafY
MKGSIENYIPVGRENKISRKSLAICTGLPDRSVRRLISDARMQGIPIVGDPAGGYYMAETEADVRLLLSELNSRITKLAKCTSEVRQKCMGLPW